MGGGGGGGGKEREQKKKKKNRRAVRPGVQVDGDFSKVGEVGGMGQQRSFLSTRYLYVLYIFGSLFYPSFSIAICPCPGLERKSLGKL